MNGTAKFSLYTETYLDDTKLRQIHPSSVLSRRQMMAAAPVLPPSGHLANLFHYFKGQICFPNYTPQGYQLTEP